MRPFVKIEPDLIMKKVDFHCLDENESFDIYMNMLDMDRIIELAEIGKKILNSQEDNYDFDDQLGYIHIDKSVAKVKSYAGRFYETSYETKDFVKLLIEALLYYELIDNPDEFFVKTLGNVDIVDSMPIEIERRLSPDVEVSNLKKKEAMGK